jgi:hypothetical protein
MPSDKDVPATAPVSTREAAKHLEEKPKAAFKPERQGYYRGAKVKPKAQA